MRKALFLLAPLVSIAALIACENDSGTGNGGTFDPDSGTFTPPDTGTADSAVEQDGDTLMPDVPTPPKNVTVHVVDGAGPVANVTIVFHDANGSVTGTAKTDATGTVVSTGAVPAQITALLGKGRAHNLLTWTSVKAGDELFARDLDSDGMTQPTLDVKLPGSYNQSDFYYANVGWCQGTSSNPTTPLTIYLDEGCVNAKSNVLSTAYQAGLPVGFSFKKDFVYPADAGTATVTTDAWVAASTLQMTAKNVPANQSAEGVLSQIVGSTSAPSRIAPVDETPTPFQFAQSYAEALQATSILRNGTSVRALVQRFAVSTNPVSFDYTQALPVIKSANTDTTNVMRPKVQWTSEGPLTSTNGGYVTMTFYDHREIGLGWTFLVPAGATDVTAPELPADAKDWIPEAVDGDASSVGFSDPEIVFVESPVLGDDASFRREAGRLLSNENPGDAWRAAKIVLPKDGTLRATAFVPFFD